MANDNRLSILNGKLNSPLREYQSLSSIRPPYSETHHVTTPVFYSEFSECLESVVLNTDPVLLVGDFNIHVDCDDNTDAVKLLELFENVGLDQHVYTPTHCSGHTLDLIVTQQTDRIIASSSRADCLFSDHMPVFCQLQLDRVPLIKLKSFVSHLAAINLDALRKDLSNSILCENVESFDLNELVDCYNKTLNSILDQYAPLKTCLVLIMNGL